MTRKNKLPISLGLWTIILLASCEYNVENEEVIVPTGCQPEVSYETTIRPLINDNCMPCHNGDGSEPFAPDLTTYNAVENIAGTVKQVTQARTMPIGSTLTQDQINAIGCWVDNGAPNN
ncbi:c-type cytochrome [Spongiimicrobium sp. 3-5]|uniref:c-type cytochrome n=1 Tax=Spongiimicrobium sp. 3-5 TaxID=3332596 RepID=UPI003980DD12